MRRAAYLSTVALLVAVAWALGRSSALPSRGAVRARSPVPGIVVICLDTLRADAVAAQPGSSGLPSLVAWGRTATRFEGALASSSWTGPSIATLLSGLQPWNHGFLEVAPGTRLPAGVPTLAGRLTRAGWSTAAVTGGGWVSRSSGLANGFETAAEDFDVLEPSAAVARWDGARPKDRPFFLFLHTYAPHDPYGDKSPAGRARCGPAHAHGIAELATALTASADPTPPDLASAYLAARLADPCRRDALVAALGGERAEALLGRFAPWLDGGWRAAPGGAALVDALRTSYLRSLRWVDARLRATLAAVASLPPDTVVVVCSDHGEAFGEHGPLHHGRFLHPELVRAVLYVRAPTWPAGRAVGGACGLVDVVPTLLELAGLPADATLDGVSLAPLARDGGDGHPVPSIVAAPAAGPEGHDLRRVAVRDHHLAWAAAYDLRSGAWLDEVWFDRRKDPGETVARPELAGQRSAAFDAVQRTVRKAVDDRYGVWSGSSAAVR